jgi:hypothetical protein
MLIRTMKGTLTHNGWVYEKVCLYEFQITKDLDANFHIHLVMCRCG